MARKVIARRHPAENHLVVVDTNILWHEDKAFPVNPDFNSFWGANSKLIPLQLIVPEVVMGELKFQQCTSALKKLHSAEEDLKILSRITAFSHSHKIKDDIVKKQINKKIDNWLYLLGGVIAPTPIKEINWGNVVQSAIWRIAPFTFDPKDKVNEKGFRDTLIFETLMHICVQNESSNNNIVFVCGDYLLRETAKERFKQNSKVLIFESLQDFGSYIHLKQKNLTDKFVKEIQVRARAKFWNGSADRTSIFYKSAIIDQISKKYPDKIDKSFDLGPPSFAAILSGLSSSTAPNNGELARNWFIGATQFRELQGKKHFCWISRVILSRYISTKSSSQSLFSLGDSTLIEKKKIQLINFDIIWGANVKEDGRFHDIKVIEINFIDSPTEEASEEAIQRWGFKGVDTK